MKKGNIKTIGMVITLAIFTILPLMAMAANMVTIEGEVNDNYQIVDSNGQVYEIADSAQGNELIENYTGAKVRVMGTVEEDAGSKIITVTSFTVISE